MLITRDSKVSLGLLFTLIGLMGGASWGLWDMRSNFLLVRSRVDSIDGHVQEMRGDLRRAIERAMDAKGERALTNAKLGELERRIEALESR